MNQDIRSISCYNTMLSKAWLLTVYLMSKVSETMVQNRLSDKCNIQIYTEQVRRDYPSSFWNISHFMSSPSFKHLGISNISTFTQLNI